MGRIILLVIILGGVLAFFGVQEMRLARVAKPDAQTVSCAKLIANGVGDNAHVSLTDFIMVPSAFVYETGKSGGAWRSVWVPVVPVDGDYHKKVVAMIERSGGNPAALSAANLPRPDDIRLIVKSNKVADEAALDALASQDTLNGIVINTISSLGSKQKKILADSYPGVNFDNVLILEHDRKPTSTGKSVGMIGGGGVISLLGVLGAIRRKTA